MGKKILFLVPYPLDTAPSQRFRFEQYFPVLRSKGFLFRVSCFLSKLHQHSLSPSASLTTMLWALICGFSRRVVDLFRAWRYDYIFVHREAAPVGPPIIEWILRYLLKRNIIYDFDDAIWLTDREDESPMHRVLKWRRKVEQLCRWSSQVSCGNDYLCNFAANFNNATTWVPSSLDTSNRHNPHLHKRVSKGDKVNIGWTGSFSTLKYLKDIESTLAEILRDYSQVRLVIIADQEPQLSTAYEFIPWNAETEIEDLLKIDIGIMPLPDNEWVKGKGAFKCLQYMALEIPSIASNVGVNSKIVDHEVNGFLVQNAEEWRTYLSKLIEDKNLRRSLGAAGRRKIIEHYSVDALTPRFLSLFR